MGQHEARVDDVELRRRGALPGRADAELDVVEPPRRHRVARQRDRGLVQVDADDAAARTRQASELAGAVAAAAADVEADHAVVDAGALEQGARRRRHHAPEDAQAIDAARAAVDDVALGPPPLMARTSGSDRDS